MPIRVATVRAADVPASQTDFPIFVDLGRVGATALTLAEANSSRWYTDTDLVTQMAREIVSLTEGHGKYASLTSTSKIAIDYDGIRADYAVTDTFGRNNVWSDYRAVWHFKEASGSRNDSTANGLTLTDNNTVTTVAGKLTGNAALFTKANSEWLSITDNTNLEFDAADTYSMTAWIRPASNFNDNATICGKYNSGGGQEYINHINPDATTSVFSGWYSPIGDSSNVAILSRNFASPLAVNTWAYLASTLDAIAQSATFYHNATSLGTSTTSGSSGIFAGTRPFDVGRRNDGVWYFDGGIQELRLRVSLLPANWITTEYNNQNAESTFWGTWTTFSGGGGFTPTPLMHMRLMAGGVV